MGRSIRGLAGHRGGRGGAGQGARHSNDDRYDPKKWYQDPSHDLRDLYEDLQGPDNDQYVWPVCGSEDED
jgi:hypothetical protein